MMRLITVAILTCACLRSSVDAAELNLVAWNLESGGNLRNKIADQIRSYEDVDIWIFSEVDAGSADAFIIAAGEGGGSTYAGLIGNTGGADRLLIVYNQSLLTLRDGFELSPMALGGGRAPLVAEFELSENGERILVVANHLHRKSAPKRLQQAREFRDWVSQQSLPLITAGDFNFDFDVPSGPGNEAYQEFLLGNVVEWERPTTLIATNWSDNNGDGDNDFDSVLDFIFTAGPAKLWQCETEIIVKNGDFPDDHTTSDHRPLLAKFDTSANSPEALSAAEAKPNLVIAKSRDANAQPPAPRLSGALIGSSRINQFNAASSASSFGHYEGDIVAKWSPDGRHMTLVEDFAYIDGRNKLWKAPKGSIVDGASIPQAFWSVIGSPFTGEFRAASVVHDVYCENKDEPWEDVHRMFYEACRCSGVSLVKAKVMYYAVYHFGPRWGDVQAMASAASEGSVSQAQVEALEAYVRWKDPSLDELESLPPVVLQPDNRD